MTPQERKVFELALEALEEINKLSVGENAICLPAEIDTAMDAIKEALSQPEQEPVAWMHNHIKGNVIAHRPADIDRHPDRWTALYPEPKPCPTCEALARTVMLDQTSHDTTPPQRTWVGLTDEDCLEALKAVDPETKRLPLGFSMFAANIEAKLKEKNNG